MHAPVEALEERLAYRFRNRELLIRALTHRSWLSERPSLAANAGDNEQLEFLGDSILGFLVSEFLLLKHPSAQEGKLSQWKAHLVSSAHLHDCALELRLGDFLLLGKGEERSGGRERKTLLANAVEALIAAMYIDGGIEVARGFIEQNLLSRLDEPRDMDALGLRNYKSVLQERTQALGLPLPRYSTIETSGPDHAKVFLVEAGVGNRLVSRAAGTSKKAASQLAAERLIEQLASGEHRDREPQLTKR